MKRKAAASIIEITKKKRLFFSTAVAAIPLARNSQPALRKTDKKQKVVSGLYCSIIPV